MDLAQDDLHIGFIGTHGNRIANMILNECDLIVSVGARLGIRQVGQFTDKFAPKADLVRCDIDEYELSRNIKEDEKKFHADARDFMRMIMEEDIPDYSKWKKQCLEAKALLTDHDKQPGNFAVEKIAEAYGIKAVALSSYEELDQYREWFTDGEPCLFDISLPQNSFLTPKIKFETGIIDPKIDEELYERVKAMLSSSLS